MKKIKIDTWNRKEHFHFFSQFDEPFFGIVAEIDCTRAYKISKENKYSFFAYYLHKSLTAVNEIPEFKYRIAGEEVVIHDELHASPTIGRDDGTFGFAYIPFNTDFQIFSNSLSAEIKRIQSSAGLAQNENTIRNDVIHYSSIPWISFKGLTHARNFKYKDSIPKISFGKVSENLSKLTMPISINGHHGLVDGLHIANFLELFQKQMDD